jgi:hypothetical protein
VCKKFNEIITNVKITIQNTSTLNHLYINYINTRSSSAYLKKTSNKKTITKQWKLSIFRVSAEDKIIEEQLQKKYNQYRLNLHLDDISKESDNYIKLMLERESEWFKNLWRRTSDIVKTKNCKLS